MENKNYLKLIILTLLLVLNTQPIILAAEDGTETKAIPEAYQTILEKYVTAADENWSVDVLHNEQMFYDMNTYGIQLNQLGFALEDINNDGTDELLIGYMGEELYDVDLNSQLLDFYTLDNEKALQLGVSEARSYYYLTINDGTVAHYGSGGATYGVTNFYNLEKDQLVFKEGLLYDSDSTYLLSSYSPEPSGSDGTLISRTEYDELRDVTYAPKNITYKSIYDYNLMTLSDEPVEVPQEEANIFTIIRDFFMRLFNFK